MVKNYSKQLSYKMTKSSQNNITLHWAVPSIFLLIAILDMPSGYYTFLRILIFGYFVFYTYNTYIKDFRNLAVVSLLFSILYNPIFPIYLYDKEIWTIINIATIIYIFINRKKLIESGLYSKSNNEDKKETPIENSVKEEEQETDLGLLKDGALDEVTNHLKNMGLNITEHGTGVAAYSLASNYTSVETASFIALATFAKEIKEINQTSKDIIKLMEYVNKSYPVISYLKECGEKQLIRPIQLQHDLNALTKVVIVSKEQDEWIEKVLSDPQTKYRLAEFSSV